MWEPTIFMLVSCVKDRNFMFLIGKLKGCDEDVMMMNVYSPKHSRMDYHLVYDNLTLFNRENSQNVHFNSKVPHNVPLPFDLPNMHSEKPCDPYKILKSQTTVKTFGRLYSMGGHSYIVGRQCRYSESFTPSSLKTSWCYLMF